jgi:hypothetical protein
MTSITFTVPDLDDRKKAGYLRLYEAAWSGDLDEVKALTLAFWKSPDDVEHPPLMVAVRDDDDFSPFALAVLRGHYSLAEAITEISLAQYELIDDVTGQRKRWTINADSEEECSDSDSDSEANAVDPNIYGKIVDDVFTIEDVTAISTVVKSHVDPLTMIEWKCRSCWFSKTTECDFNGSQEPLMKYAIQVDDMALLKLLLRLGAKYQMRALTDDNESAATYKVDSEVFSAAIAFERTAMLAELIKETGVGIPFDELAKRSGVVIQETPQYYQGLSIAGKKNLSWARSGRDRYDYAVNVQYKEPPLLLAAYFGKIDSVQWFLSDAPRQKYMEFAAANKENNTVRSLEESKDGFDKTVNKWLRTRSRSLFNIISLIFGY